MEIDSPSAKPCPFTLSLSKGDSQRTSTSSARTERMTDTTPALINAFSAYLRDDRRRSPHTVRAYVTTAERFTEFLMDHIGGGVGAEEIKAVKQADIRSYLAHRRSAGSGKGGLTNNSAARELSALRAFLKFVGGDEAQIPKIKGPKVKRGVPRPASPDDILAIAVGVAPSENPANPALRTAAV